MQSRHLGLVLYSLWIAGPSLSSFFGPSEQWNDLLTLPDKLFIVIPSALLILLAGGVLLKRRWAFRLLLGCYAVLALAFVVTWLMAGGNLTFLLLAAGMYALPLVTLLDSGTRRELALGRTDKQSVPAFPPSTPTGNSDQTY